MIKEIKYNGYSATPSDYECPDGDLAMAMGLLQENGAMKPVLPPKEVLQLETGASVMYIHETYNFRHYIIYKISDTKHELYWSDSKTPTTLTPLYCDFPDTHNIDNPFVVEAIGNVLYVSFIDDIVVRNSVSFYFIWESSGYTAYNHPPFVSMEFRLMECYSSGSFSSSIGVSDTAAAYEWCSNNGVPGQRDTSSFIHDVSNAVWGHILSFISDEITSKNYFYLPFFVRYAFRYYDGTHSLHSAPVLMIPSSGAPLVMSNVSYAEGGTINITVTPKIRYGLLLYRFLKPDIDKLKIWKNFITHVDIFCSAPIYTYDQSKEIERTFNGAIQKTSISHFDGKETTNSTVSGTFYWKIPERDSENVMTDICDCSTFYHVASIEIDDIINDPADSSDSQSAESSEWKSLNQLMDDETINSLVSRQNLKDDYNSHCDIIAKSALLYNNRLNLANILRKPFRGYPIRSMVSYRNISTDSEKYQLPYIITHISKNGQNYKAEFFPDRLEIENPYLSPFVIDSPNDMFPRYLFYPDPDATEMDIVFVARVSDSEPWRTYKVPLTRHNNLNGAYYFRGFGSDLPTYVEFDDNTTPVIPAVAGAEVVAETNKIYTSEVNNPFYFPLLGINTVGTGNILGICAAAKALSEGQFGQFPLYAFTTEGVWALEVSSTGTYSAKQPITRDVCINPDSITQIDSAVLFATDRGIMHISGSTVQCISDNLNTEDLFSIADLPKCDKLIDIFNAKADDTEQITIDDVAILPFLDFLADCRMIYDYTNQRIIVYNPAVRYAYVYSMKSQTWGMMRSNIVDNVNSYSEALAMADGATLVDFSKSDAETTTSLIITRPFKIDSPDTFKTINTIIQRGVFRSHHVQQVLYGSNDLIHWHTVWSSVDKIMRGFRGTPYKAYRLALVCRFDKAESIYGCTVVYEPRMTNQVR